MASIIGFALLLLVFSVGIFLPFFVFFLLRKSSSTQQILELDKISSILIAVIFCCAVLCQICLIYSFVTSDYSVANVYKNSHHLKPLVYKIAGSWGRHEGSMLLLISILSAYSLFFNFLSKVSLKEKIIINCSQATIIALFSAFTAFTSNPFERIFPTPNTGLGLNPILQDIGLALHPPMLYTGYIGFSLIFSFFIAALLCEKIDQKFVKNLQPWLFFSYGFLTFGIGLGSWWAYRELGWGGYWFWDPVENISLMPWIGATCLVHALKLINLRNSLKIWSAFLAILTFILCLLGIFLTRSGIMTSVHSFAIDAGRGFFIIIIISIIGGLGLLILGSKMDKIKSVTRVKKIKIFSLILANNYFLIVSLFVVLLGTTYPIFLRGFFNEFIVIGPDYYNKIFSILIIPFLVFLIFSSKKDNFFIRYNILILLVSIALTASTFFYHQGVNFLQIIILFLAIFATIISFFSGKNLAMRLAHSGFSLVISGIILTSSFQINQEVNLKKGETLKLKDFDLKFLEIEHFKGKNFIVRQGNFDVFKNDKKITNLQPQLRYYPESDQTTNETSIMHSFFGDLYLVIGNKDENENYALRAYYKPFIYFIWLGCFLIFAAAISRIKI